MVILIQTNSIATEKAIKVSILSKIGMKNYFTSVVCISSGRV
ncbi:hypothetical protein MTBBW1_1780003 [Desulfamplus magnetovallimortis]|uniref:Uncharacterized protein n=1 Tax=Desulfamplus magnetovallimortis TaxID=1246637 RepID=A0A1W1HAE5_9BACT|nr:hypothetical protein MTBBW1_1780003 [Desulfamplus magnetovallimortis]